jgi:hypothetical protein
MHSGDVVYINTVIRQPRKWMGKNTEGPKPTTPPLAEIQVSDVIARFKSQHPGSNSSHML